MNNPLIRPTRLLHVEQLNMTAKFIVSLTLSNDYWYHAVAFSHKFLVLYGIYQ